MCSLILKPSRPLAKGKLACLVRAFCLSKGSITIATSFRYVLSIVHTQSCFLSRFLLCNGIGLCFQAL
jgi:hypothetical protein